VKIVLDTSALFLYFYGNKKAKDIIEKNMSEAFVNSVNLTEFLYSYAKVKGWKESLFKYTLIRNTFKLIDVNNEDIIKSTAKLKIKYNLSLGDALLLASAKSINSTAVTSDHELSKVKDVKVILIPNA